MDENKEYTPTQKNELQTATHSSSVEKAKFALGHVLLGKYKVTRIIQGGMGIVYVVSDIKQRWDYAVKTLAISEQGLKGREFEQFVEEIKRLIELPPHPNIVQVDFVKPIDNQPYLFMEFVEGGDLRNELNKTKGKRLSFDVAFDVALQICEGMQFIHDKGHILHLDLKPENFLINRKGVVKISDFGISTTSRSLSRKAAKETAGTYLYMSPEQIEGKEVDVWSDIYSFGIIFYEMLAGKLPYPFDINSIPDKQTLLQKLHEFHRSEYDFHNRFSHTRIIEELPSEFGTIVGHCLAKLPSKRVPDFRYLQRWIEKDFGKYKRVNRVDPLEIDPYRKALNFQVIGQHSRALEYFNRALEIYPSNSDLYDDVANSLFALGMEQEGKRFRNMAK